MRHRRVFGRVWTGVVAAAVTGIPAAVVTRLLMRLIAHTVNDQPEFSLSGSVGIVLIYVAGLLPGCVALACSHPPVAVASVLGRRCPFHVRSHCDRC